MIPATWWGAAPDDDPGEHLVCAPAVTPMSSGTWGEYSGPYDSRGRWAAELRAEQGEAVA